MQYFFCLQICSESPVCVTIANWLHQNDWLVFFNVKTIDEVWAAVVGGIFPET